MGKYIYFKRADGRETIRIPAKQSDVAHVWPEVMNLNEDEYLEYVKNHNLPEGATDVQIVDDNFRTAKKADWESKRQEKEDAKKSKRQAVLSKLKISEQDLKDLLNG